MKRVLLLCLMGVTALPTYAAQSNPPQLVQPFTAVGWTTTTLHSPSGKATVFMRRTVYTRDAAGNVRREMYQPTKGAEHDTTAPAERVVTGTTSADALLSIRSSKETVEEDVDLGASQFSGLPTVGRRQTFHDASGQRTHALETWFCATLGLTVRMESRNARGDTTVTEMSDLHLGNPDTPAADTVQVAKPAIPLLVLYRGLFREISHMERDRLANDPSFHVNMEEIEDHLRKEIGLSAKEWQAVVDKSVTVESYTRERSKEARTFADQDRAARRQNPQAANTLAAGRAKLHAMQLDLNTHVQGEIDELKASVGADATDRLQAYLQGTLAASTSVVSSRSVHPQVKKEQAQ